MGDLAQFDRHRFGNLVRERLRADGRGYRQLGRAIGVTASDLSRIGSAQAVAIEKALAVAQWAGLDVADFYIPPDRETPPVFHVAGTETLPLHAEGAVSPADLDIAAGMGVSGLMLTDFWPGTMGKVHILTASPPCVHFSKPKGAA